MQLDFLSKLLKPSAPPVALPERPRMPPRAAGQREAKELTEQARALLTGLGCNELASRVHVWWNPRMRSTAGTAFAAKALINLNSRLREFGEEEVQRTMVHELAHLLAHFRAGRRRIAPHGPEWRAACRDLGLHDEKRCHELPLPRRQRERRHRYQCPACGVTMQRVQPLRKKSACLACCKKHNRGKYDERFRFVKTA